MSNLNTAFKRTFRPCRPNLIFSFKDSVYTKNAFTKGVFRSILGLLDLIVPNFLLNYLGYLYLKVGVFPVNPRIVSSCVHSI